MMKENTKSKCQPGVICGELLMLRAQDFGVKDVLDTRTTRLGKLFMAECRGQPERMKTERRFVTGLKGLRQGTNPLSGSVCSSSVVQTEAGDHQTYIRLRI